MAKKPRFAIGDSVKLKSGGPVMTVDGYAVFDEGTVICKWFAGKKLHIGNFDEDAIERATELKEEE